MTEYILSNEQIEDAWGNANFGKNASKRDIIGNALLKWVCDYHSGHTIECICEELELIKKPYLLTPKGKQYLYAHFSKELS